MTPIRIALADDHTLFRDGISRILSSHKGLDVRIESANGRELLEKIGRQRVDVVVTDISMPDIDGEMLARHISKDFKGIQVLALSMHDSLYHIKKMLAAGARGYVLKEANPEELVTSLKQVNQGKMAFCSGSLAVLTRNVAGWQHNDNHLTQREMVVLKLIFDERSDQEIAGLLRISLKTVANDRKELFRKTNTKTPIGLVKWVIDKGGLDGL
jgi:DNA-binding NarL/FixJ family response regulator